MRIAWMCFAVGSAMGVCAAGAQMATSAKRSDGQMTPLEIYKAVGEIGGSVGCAPLAVISHGAGGSEHQLEYLGRALSADGFMVVLMGHRESELPALRADIRADGFVGGLRALVADKSAESARLLDVGAALEWAEG